MGGDQKPCTATQHKPYDRYHGCCDPTSVNKYHGWMAINHTDILEVKGMKDQRVIGILLLVITILLGISIGDFTLMLVILPSALCLIFSKYDWTANRYGDPRREK